MKTLKNIARGVALLDEKQPGWEHRIDLNTLRLSSSCDCVCGQLVRRGAKYSRYQRMLAILGLSFPDGAAYGFTTWGRQSFDRLTDEWTRVIRAKRDGHEIEAE